MKRTRLAVECLESRDLLAVAAGAVLPFGAAAFPLPTADEGVVLLAGEGDSPAAGDGESELAIRLSTSRTIVSDFSSLTLYVGIRDAGLSAVSLSEFDPEQAGFQVGDPSLDEVPDISLTPLFTTNLISNGSCAFYLYAGGDDAPVEGRWYLKAVWFDLSLSGDWTGGADTAGSGIELAAFHLNFEEKLIAPAEVRIDFAAECGEDWTAEADPYIVTAGPGTTEDLVACAAPAAVSVQTGCRFFLSGAGSYSVSGRQIQDWLWDITGSGTADARGEERWFAADKMFFSDGSSSVFLAVRDADGNLSPPARIAVTQSGVAPSVTGTLSAFAGGRVVLADICYTDAAGEAGAFWEIDWGDGAIDEFESLSKTVSAAHVYETGVSAVPSVRVTDAKGNVSSFIRIG